jgi:hemerythrin-like domain-containing protein
VNIVDTLLGEHAVMYAHFDFLEQTLPGLGDLAEIRVLGTVLAAVVQSHSTVEDDLLFAALEEPLGAVSPALVGMRMMHEDIDRGFAEFEQAEDATAAREALLGVIGLARQHFLGEEESLFPTARRVLDGETLGRLGAAWAARRSVLRNPIDDWTSATHGA